MIAIHDSKAGFHPIWVKYCEKENIPFKRIDCYSSNLIAELQGCDGLLWHHDQNNVRDRILARPVLAALEHSGFPVFPDQNSAWHFDDKIAQKYIFESFGIATPDTFVSANYSDSMQWVEAADFPKVFKLRGGAGAENVILVRHAQQARKLIRRAFGPGFFRYSRISSLKERWRNYRIGKADWTQPLKGLVRLLIPPRHARRLPRERDYVLFQDFVPGNDFDTRVIVIGDRAVARRRFVRENDFRASGSGINDYDHEKIELDFVLHGFACAKLLGTQSLALDYVRNADGAPLLLEISYGFVTSDYPGYWDRELQWHPGAVCPQEWIVDMFAKKPVRPV